MNARSFKVIFSKRLGALVAVGENATSQGKSASGETSHSGALALDVLSSATQYTGMLKALCLAALIGALPKAFALDATALPTGADVRHGSATVGTEGATMTINQSTSRATINWQSFNLGTDARVNVVQNDSQSVLLNRVVGNEMSQIRGQISANGQVVLVNPNGIVMGSTGRITASAFTASTFGITDANFEAGHMKYERNGSTGQIVHQGHIQTAEAGGYVALIGAEVSNQGTITTRQGAVVLAAADAVTLPSVTAINTVSVPLSSKVRLELNPDSFGSASVSNSGVIVTDGGQVLMRAASVVDAVSKVANATVIQSGSIDTTGVQGGGVDILADHGRIRVSGSVKANSSNGTAGGDIYIGRDKATNILAAIGDASGARLESKGGFIETSGDYLSTRNIQIKAKDWLLDPTNIRIVGSGTTTAASSNVGGATGTTTFNGPSGISDSLVFRDDIQNAINAGTNVKIDTANITPGANGSGNITIETALTFNNNTANAATLSLLAKNGITQNTGASITNTGTGLVHVVMVAEGLHRGVPVAAGTNNTSSNGITLNSTIKTNGDVTITGTTANSGQHGVRFSNGSGIEARSYNVTGRMTASSGGNQGTAQGSGVVFTGTSAFKSTENSKITASTGSAGVFGVHFHNGSTVTFDTGGAKLVVATDEANMGSGVKIGWAGGAVINTKGDVTLGSLNTNAFTHIQGTVNASGNTVNQVGSLKLLGKSAGSNGGISSQDGGGVVARVIATGDTTIDMEGVATGAAHGVNLGITLGSPISSERGKITIKGTTTTASGFNGVNVMNNTSITSASGDIHITGNSASNTNAAVRLNWGTVATSGNIEVTGTSTTASALGVWTDNAKVTGSNVTVSGTSVSAAGVHLGNGVDNSVNGLFEANGTAPESGLLKVTGVSQSGTAVQSQSGTMRATNNIVIDALSNTGNGVVMTGTNGIQSTGGDVTIKTDSLNLATTAVGITANSGLVSIQNKTAGTSVNLGGSDVLTGTKVLGITNAELNKIAANQTEIGSSTAGNLTVSSAVTSLDATGDLSLRTGGNIDIANNLTVGTSGGNNLTLEAAGANSTTGGNGVVKAEALKIAGANAQVAMSGVAHQIKNLSADVKSLAFKNTRALTVAAKTNGGSIKVETTEGTLTVGKVIGFDGVTAVDGDITLEGKTSAGHGLVIGLGAKVETAKDVKLVGTTSDGSTSDVAGVHSLFGSMVKGKKIEMLATANSTNAEGKTLGYYGAGGSFEASESLNMTGMSNNNGNGFYTWGGSFKAQKGIVIEGTSDNGQGVGFDQPNTNGALVQIENGTPGVSSNGGVTIRGDAKVDGKQGVGLNGVNIINNGTGDIDIWTVNGHIEATNTFGGTNTITNGANGGEVILEAGVDGVNPSGNNSRIDGTHLTITQNSDDGVFMGAPGNGDVTVAEIINNGTGAVEIMAGYDKEAGTGTGGQIKTVADNTITNTNGTTRLYSGAADSTGDLSLLDASLANLYLSDVIGNQKKNTQFNSDADATINNGPTVQVFFRETSSIGQGALNGAVLEKTYGDASTKEGQGQALLADMVTKLKGVNSGLQEKSTSAGKLIITKSVLIDDLAAANQNVALTDPQYSSARFLRANSDGYGNTPINTGAAHGTTLKTDQTTKVVVSKKTLNLTGLTAQDKAFDSTTTAILTGTPTVDLPDELSTDKVNVDSTSANFNNALVGDNKPVTVLAGLSGDDKDNYTLVLPTNLTASITGAVEPIDPPGPVVPPTPPSPNNNTVVVAGGSNSFQLAGAEATCSADTLEQCECESATSTAGVAMTGVQICYEPKNGPSSAL